MFAIMADIYPFNKDIIVSASAGTGKTYCLVELYTRLITGKAGAAGKPLLPEQILAITFTRKAAAEMRVRVRNNLKETDFYHSRGIHRCQLEIRNFHSFGHQLLRQHPLETGLPSSLTLLGEDESRRMLMGIIDDLLLEQLGFNSREINELLGVYGFSSKKVTSLNQMLLTGYIRLRQRGIPISDSREATLNTFEEFSSSPSPAELVEKTVGFIRTISQINTTNKGITSFLEAWPAYAPSFQDPGQAETSVWFDNLKAIRKLADKAKEKRVNGQRQELVECFNRYIDYRHLSLARPQTETFFDLLERIGERYGQQKKSRGVIDYDDQIFLAVRLLKDNPEILEQYRNTFKVIMVDEFQDTNHLQKELIDLLHGTQNRLFVVGDPKQAIYRFRGSDVSVFDQLKSEMLSRRAGEVSLRSSYRSAPELIAFFNKFFEKDSGERKFPYAFRYREKDNLLASDPVRQKAGRVELIEMAGEEGKKIPAEIRRVREGEIIAGKILKLTSAGAWQFKDIAVLFQSLNQVGIYERALQEKGIPCYLVGGRNLFKCREILDIYN
ncbi:MAG: UvrD-helicase domain-containing protein, partial [bacterium]